MAKNDSYDNAKNDTIEEKWVTEWREGFAGRLRELRHLVGFTVEQFAGMTLVSKRTQSAYEAGQRFPDASYLYLLAAMFNADISYLVVGESSADVVRRTAVNEHPFLRQYESLDAKKRAVVNDVLHMALSAQMSETTLKMLKD